MTRREQENLLGYLLGALSAEEQRQTAEALEGDAALRAELKRLEEQLEQLPPPIDDEPPPADLAGRTCDFVFASRSKPSNKPAGNPVDAPKKTLASSPYASPAFEFAVPRSRRSWIDFAVAAASCVCAAALFLPMIAHSHQQGQIIQCQDHLRRLGVALAGYNDRHDGRFPYIPRSGNRSAAGLFGPTLKDEQLIVDDRVVLCPGAVPPRCDEPFEIPALAQIDAAEGPQLVLIRQRMGGDFAFNMGFFDDGLHCAPINSGRSNYPIMADAPSHANAQRTSTNHALRGQNVLFEDFHIRFVTGCKSGNCGDPFYINRQNVAAAGVDPLDVALGASATKP